MDDNDKESMPIEIKDAGKKAAESEDFVENVEKASFAKQQDKQQQKQQSEAMKETKHEEEGKHKSELTKSLKDYNERDGCSPMSHGNDASRRSKQHSEKHRRIKEDTRRPSPSTASSSGERHRREERHTEYHRSKHDSRKLSPSPTRYKSSPSERRDTSRHAQHNRRDSHERTTSHHGHGHGHHSQRSDKYHHKQRHSTSRRTSEPKTHSSKNSTPDGNVEETSTDKTQHHSVKKPPKAAVDVVAALDVDRSSSCESSSVKSAGTTNTAKKSLINTDESSKDVSTHESAMDVIELSTPTDTADAKPQDVTVDDDKTIPDSGNDPEDNVTTSTVFECNTDSELVVVGELEDGPKDSPKAKGIIVDWHDIIQLNDDKPNETIKRQRQSSDERENVESTASKRRRDSNSTTHLTSDESDVLTSPKNEANDNLPGTSKELIQNETSKTPESEDKEVNIITENSKALNVSEETDSSDESTVVEVRPTNELTDEDVVDLMEAESDHESNDQQGEEQADSFSEEDIYLLGYNETGNPLIFYCENDPLKQNYCTIVAKSPPSSPIEFVSLPSDVADLPMPTDNIDKSDNNEELIVANAKPMEQEEEEETSSKSISSYMSLTADSISQEQTSVSVGSRSVLAVDLTEETVVDGIEQTVELPLTIESDVGEDDNDQQQQPELNKSADTNDDEFDDTLISDTIDSKISNQIGNEGNTESTEDSFLLQNQEAAAAAEQSGCLYDDMPSNSELQNEEQLRELGENYVVVVIKGKLLGLPKLTREEIWECLQNAGYKPSNINSDDEKAIDMVEEDPKLLYKLMSKKDIGELKRAQWSFNVDDEDDEDDQETAEDAELDEQLDANIKKLLKLKQENADVGDNDDQTNVYIKDDKTEFQNVNIEDDGIQNDQMEDDELQQHDDVEDYNFQHDQHDDDDDDGDGNNDGEGNENELNYEHLEISGKTPITLRLSPTTLSQLKRFPTYFKTLRKHNRVIEEMPTEIETTTTTTTAGTANESAKRAKRKRRHSGKHGKHHRRSKRRRHSTHENDTTNTSDQLTNESSSAQTIHIVGEENNENDNDVVMENPTTNDNETGDQNATTFNTDESIFLTPLAGASAPTTVAATAPAAIAVASTSTSSMVSIKKGSSTKRRLSMSAQQGAKTKQLQLSAKDDFFKKPFQYGWKRELVWRSNLDSTSKADVYFIAPNGKKFRSRSDIAPLLEGDLTIEHFCFIREPQDVGAEYELVRNAKSANRTTVTPPTTTSAGFNKDAPPLVTGKRISKPKAPKGASPPPEGWTAVRALRSNNAALTQKLPYDHDISERSFTYAADRATGRSATQAEPTGGAATAAAVVAATVAAAAASVECKLTDTTSNGTLGNYIYTSQVEPVSDQGYTGQKHKPWPACDVDCERGKGKQPPLKCKLCQKRFHYACVGLKESRGKYFMRYASEDPQLVTHEGAEYYCVPCAERFGCTRSVTEIPETETKETNEMNSHTHTQQIVVIGGKKYILNSRPPEPTEAHIQMPTEARPDLKRLQKTIIFQHRGKVMPEFRNSPEDEEEDTVSNASTMTTQAQTKDFMLNLTDGYNLLVHIMQKLPLQDCLRAGLVCQLWQAATNDRRIWQCVHVSDIRITNWQNFFNMLRRMGTRELSLSAMLKPNDADNDEVWRIFMREIGNVQTLVKLEMPRCPARVVESIMQSNRQLNVLIAQSIDDDCLTLNHIGEMSDLQKLYLCPLDKSNLGGDFHGVRLKELTQLSLTNFNNLHEKTISRLSMLINLRSLELGDCSCMDAQRLADVLLSMVNLRRLRIELGIVREPKTEFCVLELLKVVQYLENLKRLELINFDVKLGFDKALSKCKNLRKLLLIPTYILQSATTNNIIMNGVHSLESTLQNFTWVFTIELLRVTALYINGDRTDDSIPILRPVPGDPDDHAEINESNGGDDADGETVNEEQHVAIVTLKTVEEIMKNRMPYTNFKIVKIFYGNTLKQQLEDELSP